MRETVLAGRDTQTLRLWWISSQATARIGFVIEFGLSEQHSLGVIEEIETLVSAAVIRGFLELPYGACQKPVRLASVSFVAAFVIAEQAR